MSEQTLKDWRTEAAALKCDFATLWNKLSRWQADKMCSCIYLRAYAHLDIPLYNAGICFKWADGAYMLASKIVGDIAYILRVMPGGIMQAEARRGERIIAHDCYLIGGKSAAQLKGVVNELSFQSAEVNPIMLNLVDTLASNLAKVRELEV